jgi:WD40 repeat protein
VAVSSDGEHIVAVGDAGAVRTWDLASGRERTQKVGTGEIFAAAFSPDGRRYAAGNKDGVIWVWSVAGGPRIELRGQGSRVYDIGFGPTNDRLVSAGDDGTARIWDAVGSVVIKAPTANGIDVSSDGRFLATSNEGGTTRVWETATGRLVTSLKGTGDWNTAKFSPKNDTLVLGSDASRDIRLWHFAKGGGGGVDEVRTDDKVGAARLDPTGSRLVYVDMGGTIVVRGESGAQVPLRGGQKLIYDAQFSPDGKRVAAIGENSDIAIWRIDRPDRPERILKGHRGHLNSFTYARDGRLASAGADGTIRVWNTSSGAAVVIQGHASEVTGVTFTHDGRRVLSTSYDATVRMWDSRTGVPVAILQSGSSDLLDVQLTPDGKIVTQGLDSVSISECEVCGSLSQVRAQALARKPRQLTADERRRYLGEAG